MQPGGGFVIAYTSSVGDGDGSGVFAQRFQATPTEVIFSSEPINGQEEEARLTELA